MEARSEAVYQAAAKRLRATLLSDSVRAHLKVSPAAPGCALSVEGEALQAEQQRAAILGSASKKRAAEQAALRSITQEQERELQ